VYIHLMFLNNWNTTMRVYAISSAGPHYSIKLVTER